MVVHVIVNPYPIDVPLCQSNLWSGGCAIDQNNLSLSDARLSKGLLSHTKDKIRREGRVVQHQFSGTESSLNRRDEGKNGIDFDLQPTSKVRVNENEQ